MFCLQSCFIFAFFFLFVRLVMDELPAGRPREGRGNLLTAVWLQRQRSAQRVPLARSRIPSPASRLPACQRVLGQAGQESRGSERGKRGTQTKNPAAWRFFRKQA